MEKFEKYLGENYDFDILDLEEHNLEHRKKLDYKYVKCCATCDNYDIDWRKSLMYCLSVEVAEQFGLEEKDVDIVTRPGRLCKYFKPTHSNRHLLA